MYKKLYFTLFNAITDALDAMKEQNFGTAQNILRAAQQKAEDIYLDQED